MVSRIDLFVQIAHVIKKVQCCTLFLFYAYRSIHETEKAVIFKLWGNPSDCQK